VIAGTCRGGSRKHGRAADRSGVHDVEAGREQFLPFTRTRLTALDRQIRRGAAAGAPLPAGLKAFAISVQAPSSGCPKIRIDDGHIAGARLVAQKDRGDETPTSMTADR